MDLPRVLIISTFSFENAKNIARDMGSELVASNEDNHHYLWTIDNKYYTAKVILLVTNASPKDIVPCDVEAIILHHDPKAKDIESLDEYLPLVHSFGGADIFLLACRSFENSAMRARVSEWSQINKFEIIEMECSSEIMDEEVDDDNVCGIERIIEVLHTHLWPNRILKELANPRIETTSVVDKVEDQLGNMRLNSETQMNSDQLLMESVLDGIMGEQNTDFGELFGRLKDMKEHTLTLSTDHRRVAAEQLVTAFWKAMGGDPSEIDDIDQ